MKLGQTVSPRKLAIALNVSESSVKRWCDQGILPSTRTPGGHRRIPVQVAVDFARKNGKSVSRPDILGLPPSVRSGVAKELLPRFVQALIHGDEIATREAMRGFCFDKTSVTGAFDELLLPALKIVSAGCSDGSVKTHEQRKSWSIVSAVLAEIRLMITPNSDGPFVCGGAFCSGTVGIDVQMAEIVLRNEGWHAVSYGCDCSPELLLQAARDATSTPQAMWLSVSGSANSDAFAGRLESLASSLDLMNIPLFIIGPTVESILQVPANVKVCRSHADFLKQLEAVRTNGPQDVAVS